MSPQSKSFVFLSILALVGTYLCLMLWAGLVSYSGSGVNIPAAYNYNELGLMPPKNPITPAAAAQAAAAQIDTSAWKTFTNKEFGFSFKYNPAWKVLKPITKKGYTVFQIDPGSKYYNIKIYVSQKDYYIMGGLPTVGESIGGQQAMNVNNQLYGIAANGFYYTFDVGWSMSLVPQFVALVHSVKFGS